MTNEQEQRYNKLIELFGNVVTLSKDVCVHTLAHSACSFRPNDSYSTCNNANLAGTPLGYFETREKAIIWETYALNRHDLSKLVDACEQFKLACMISAELSHHSVGYSVLIAIYNPKDVTGLYPDYLD